MERIKQYDSLLNDNNVSFVNDVIFNKIQPYYDYFMRFDTVDSLLNTSNEICFILLLNNFITRFTSYNFLNNYKILKYFCINASKNGLLLIVKHIINTYNLHHVIIECLDSAIDERWKIFRYTFEKNEITNNKRKKIIHFITKICKYITKYEIIQYRSNITVNLYKSKSKEHDELGTITFFKTLW